MSRRLCWPLLVALALPSAAWAGPKPKNLLEWVQTRDELSAGDRKRWVKEVKKRFGGAAPPQRRAMR